MKAFLRRAARQVVRLWRIERPGYTAIIRPRQWLPLAAFVALLGWYIARPDGVAVMGLVMLAGLLLAAYLWVRTMALKVSGKRHLRFSALQVGDEMEEEIGLVNFSFLPVLWAEFSDHSNLPAYTVSSVRAADSSSAPTWRAHTICTRRGVFNLGPWELTMGDPFGIFQVQQFYTQRNEILVYPQLAPLPQSLMARFHTQGEHRPLRQPLVAETVNAFGARPYAPGDPLRHIHWPTTARKDAVFVKSFEPQATSTVWLVPDFDAAVQAGEGDETTTEVMVTLLASLAAQYLKDHLAVGLFALTDDLHLVRPQRGPAHLWDILRTLAPLQPAANRPFGVTLAQLGELVGRSSSPLYGGQGLLMLVTPSLDPNWPRGLRQVMRGRAAGVQAVLLDPSSFDPGASGDTPAGRTSEVFAALLADVGIGARVVRKGDIKPISGAYGGLHRWDFITLGTGRVVVRHSPRQAPAMPEVFAEQRPGEEG